MAFPVTHTSERGFSLVELLVVTAVIALVTSAVLANHAKFGTTVVLERLVYDVGLTLHKAQTYGISVYRSTSGTFAQSYGMYFNITTPSASILFADQVSVNGIYDNGESLELQTLPNGYTVYDLCVTPAFGVENCAITRLDISFSRPDPDALIYAEGGATTYSTARIVVRSPQGDTRNIVVEASGQIVIN